MRARILDFVQTLRARGGVEVSVAESLDALVAVAAVGVEREPMREALAAALVKHEADRPAFDRLFDQAFPLVGGAEEGRRRRRGAGGGAVPTGAGRRRLRPAREPRRACAPAPRPPLPRIHLARRGGGPGAGTRAGRASPRPAGAARAPGASRARGLPPHDPSLDVERRRAGPSPLPGTAPGAPRPGRALRSLRLGRGGERAAAGAHRARGRPLPPRAPLRLCRPPLPG